MSALGRWLLFANHARDFAESRRFKLIRPMACQQFVKQNAERIDIARRGDLIAAHLLRAGVFRRQQMQPRSRQRAGGRRLLRE